MRFVRKHKILVTVLLVLSLIVVFSLLRERGVTRVEQTGAPSNQAVQQAIEENSQSPAAQMPPAESGDKVLKSGTFVNGAKAYKGSGTVRVATVGGKPVLQLGEDFTTTSGPDLQVYLSPNADAKTQGLGNFVTLGGLQKQQGAQVYNLPDNYAEYASVVVYCRAFTAVFTQATLQ